MKIVFRADATVQMGTGHLMRSMALAHRLEDIGWNVVFITYCDNKSLRERVSRELSNVIFLESTDERESLKTLVSKTEIDWFILDGYHFNETFQKLFKDTGHNLLVIDDYAHLNHYYADIVLNQNYGSEKLQYSCEPNTKLLLGANYSLLRKEFLKYTGYKRELREVAGNILITMGGSDPDNYTFKILNAINKLDIPLDLKIVLGASNQNYDSFKYLAKNNVEILFSVEDMASLMAWADIGVSAGGITLWEMAYMGLPTVLCIVAENQSNSVNALSREGYPSLDWIKNADSEFIMETVKNLLFNKELRNMLSKKGPEIVNGEGVEIVIKDFINKHVMDNLVIRKAEKKDLTNTFKLSNQEDVRNNSFIKDTIDYEDHVKWFNNKLSDKKSLFLVAEAKNEFLGQIRFDRDKNNDDIADISISIDKSIRGMGMGKIILDRAIKYLLSTALNIIIINSYIKKDNIFSQNFFIKAGFRFDKEVVINNLRALEYSYKIAK